MLFDIFTNWTLSLIFWLVILIIFLIPYSYILARFISKAWHKSKEQEKTYHG